MEIEQEQKQHGYGGVCPPSGHGPYRYFFKLYALAQTSTSGVESRW
ncbi:MAG: hypothetical protein JXJ20_01065 [Anaerolineae bacterium]|nr:hypothetical protein [Anaerolineae bacterium]